jgi:hypothetical protein
MLMKKVVVYLFLGAALGQVANISRSQTYSSDSYSMAMKLWEKDEKVTISAGARDLIGSSFKQNQKRLSVLGGDQKWKGGDRTLNQTLVIYYLDDLRDSKARPEPEASATPVPMKQAPAETKDQLPRGEWKSFAIELADVEAYPVNAFLNKIEPVLKGNKGELHVLSDPTGAAITLDKESRGNTEKTTVERAGEHDIAVSSTKGHLRCADKVRVPADGSVTFHCP